MGVIKSKIIQEKGKEAKAFPQTNIYVEAEVLKTERMEKEYKMMQTGTVDTKEKYESSRLKHISKEFSKFHSRISQNPFQLVRYGGDPLIVSALPDIKKCPNCGSSRMFELQLISTCFFFLKIDVDILTVLIYVCLQASKLYATVMMEALLGNILGAAAKQIFRMLLMSLLIGFGVVAAVLGTLLISLEAGYILMILIVVVLTAGFMLIASSAFDKMEAID
jgi:hypothetical protein